jgi:hypothetical protein
LIGDFAAVDLDAFDFDAFAFTDAFDFAILASRELHLSSTGTWCRYSPGRRSIASLGAWSGSLLPVE